MTTLFEEIGVHKVLVHLSLGCMVNSAGGLSTGLATSIDPRTFVNSFSSKEIEAKQDTQFQFLCNPYRTDHKIVKGLMQGVRKRQVYPSFNNRERWPVSRKQRNQHHYIKTDQMEGCLSYGEPTG